MDSAFLAAPQVSDKGYLAAQVNGTFFNPDHPQAGPYTPVQTPSRDDAGKDFQYFVTDYSINTLLHSRYLAQSQDNLSDLLQPLGKNITTDELGAVIPQILTKYGSGVAVDVLFQFANEEPQFQFTTENASLKGSNIITLQIKGENAIVALNEGANISLHLSVNNGKLFGKIDNYSVGKITI